MTTKLKKVFKNIGRFSDSCSCRYECKLNNICNVYIEAYNILDYGVSWYIRYQSTDLDLQKLFNKINILIDPTNTKKQAIETVEYMLENDEVLKNIR